MTEDVREIFTGKEAKSLAMKSILRGATLHEAVTQFRSLLRDTAMAMTKGNKSKAAQLLNVHRNTMHYYKGKAS